MKHLLLAGAVVFALSMPASAQTVNPPVVVPGDHWVYQTGIGKQSLTVTEVKADGTIVAQIESPSLGGQEARFTKDWNVVLQPQDLAGNTVFLHYNPPVCVMPPSPWNVGQTWSCASKFDLGNRVGIVEVSGKIEAMEKITVPAGTFDALRVREKVGGVASVAWYSPVARQFVKIDAGANSSYSMELTSYTVK
jgi:hypothetical protein